MVASPVQFPSITPIQNVEYPATRAWLQDMRLQTYAALDWATVAVHPQSLNILQQLAAGDRVMIDDVHFEVTESLIEQRLSLPADGVTSGFAQVTALEME